MELIIYRCSNLENLSCKTHVTIIKFDFHLLVYYTQDFNVSE